MKKILLAAAATMAIAAPAFAADLPARTYSKAPVMVNPIYDWTGFYVGANAGGAWENSQTNYSYTTFPASAPPGFEDAFGTGPGGVSSAIAAGFIPGSLGKKNVGVFTAGGQFGYNAQFNQFVVGFEADLNWLNDSKKTTLFIASPNVAPLTNVASSTAGLEWLGTVRGRFGFAADRALFYVTGGLAYGEAKASSAAAISDTINTDLYAGSLSKVRTGYTVGGGLEYAITNNISLKGEYLYYNLGSASYAVAPANSFATGEGIATVATQKFDGSIARAGINYRFGGPVVARY